MVTPDDPQLCDAALKAHLHRAFDGQIPNYGSYNLVYATASAGSGGNMIIGFRRQPLEIVLAPINPASLTARESPFSINMTNLSSLAEVRDGGFEVGTSTGRVFRFEVVAAPSVVVPESVFPSHGSAQSQALLEQRRDAEEFAAFMDEFMTALEAAMSGGKP